MFKEVKVVEGTKGADKVSDKFIRVDLTRGYFSLGSGLVDALLIYEGLYIGILEESEKENKHDVFKFAMYVSNNRKNCRKVFRNIGTGTDFRVKNTLFTKNVASLFPKTPVSVRFYIKPSIFFYQTINAEKVKIYPLFLDKSFIEKEYPEYLDLVNSYEEEIIRTYGKSKNSGQGDSMP